MKKLHLPKIRMFDEDSKAGIPQGNIAFVIAFVVPLIMFIALYYVREIFPFGSNCYLRSDMYHQYAPFFSEFWYKLRNGGSLTYSWDIGMGTNFTALYAYYLASPVNWLIFLFPQKYMIEIMNVLIILKLSAASVAFSYYLSKHFHTKSCMIALFGMFYGMSGYVAAYSWNIMWLDCIILLPLIFLGLERLVNENKCLLYCISLGLCIFTNYYISIMVCISVVIYFVVLLCCYSGTKHFKIYLKKILHFGIYSLLAGGIAACLLLPELYALSLSASSNVAFPQTLTNYFSIMEMLVRQLIDVPVHLGLDHYPNIYCGVAVFLLIPLYIMNKRIDSREKISKILVLIIFLTSFNLNIPNFIWHGFHYPNSLPCRQAFIYIFFLLAMSYEALKDIRLYSAKELMTSAGLAFGFLLVAEKLFAGDTYNFKIMYLSGAFMLAYVLIIYFFRRAVKTPVILFLVFVTTIIECTMNMESTGLSTTNRTYYVTDNAAISNVVNYASENDDSFYRIEKYSGIRSKNDAAWSNYKNASVFSSTSSAGMSALYGALGCEHSTNAYAFKGGTLVTSCMFGVKYALGNQILAESNLRKFYYGNDGEFLYENQYTLPVGYMVNGDINNLWKVDSLINGFEVQNQFMEINTGIKDVFKKMYEYKTETDVTFNPTTSGHLYMVVQNQNLDSVGVSVNGTVTNYTGLKNANYIIDIGYATPNDSIEVYGDVSLNASVYYLDDAKFISAYNTLNQGGLNVTSHTDTSIKGSVTATNDGAMLFSIPFDKGWSVKIDGKKVSTFAIKDALLGVNVPAGTHEISLSYTPVGLIKGLIITALSIALLVAFTLLKKRLREGKLDPKKLPVFVQELCNEEDTLIENTNMTLKLASMLGVDSKQGVDSTENIDYDNEDVVEISDTANKESDNSTSGSSNSDCSDSL